LLAIGLVSRTPGAAAQSCDVGPALRGPVSILILASAAKVHEFASAVQGARIVVRENETVIFEDGRVVTASPDSATRHVNALGWGERGVQIVASFPLQPVGPPRRPG
jgi:hypothetical protein